MKPKYLLIVVPLLLPVTGCSLFAPEPPAKVAVQKVPVKKPAALKDQTGMANTQKPAASKGPTTYAIESSTGTFNDQLTTPTFNAQPITVPSGTPAQTPQTGGTQAPALETPIPDSQAAMSAQGTTTQVATQPPINIVMEDAAIPAGTSPAVVALVGASDRSRKEGDLNAAVVEMERALRIDSRNPTITYKLAQLRLKQSKPQQAEELAGKASLLAGNDLDLKRKSWLLIAEARKLQQNIAGAKQAKAKAESFFGH